MFRHDFRMATILFQLHQAREDRAPAAKLVPCVPARDQRRLDRGSGASAPPDAGIHGLFPSTGLPNYLIIQARMGGRAVEGTGLENRQGSAPLVGSNPTPSASYTVKSMTYRKQTGSTHFVPHENKKGAAGATPPTLPIAGDRFQRRRSRISAIFSACCGA